MGEKREIRILGIETSCDETAAAVTKNGSHAFRSIGYCNAEDVCDGGGE